MRNPAAVYFSERLGGWEEDKVEDGALFLMVFLWLHLWYGFTVSGKPIVPLGAEEFGVSSKKVLQNISEHRRDMWCVYCGYTTFHRDIVTFVSFLFPAFHLTCHVFPVNSAPHSFPCQLNADDFRPLRRTIKETFHGSVRSIVHDSHISQSTQNLWILRHLVCKNFPYSCSSHFMIT